MAFFDFFKNLKESEPQKYSQLHGKIQNLLPKAEEKELVLVTCVAGLLARVAYIDFDLHSKEISRMEQALTNWSNLSQEDVQAVVKLANDEIKELAGLENHKYCYPLNEILSNDEKYHVLESLFALAGSDGTVESKEEEEIRVIATGLKLSHKHFISARATVLDKLGSLNR